MLRINIKSFQSSLLMQTISKINEIALFLKLGDAKVIGLPVKEKLYTVLRSPHKDKKSREQFESKRWKAQIIINAKNKKNLTGLLFFLIKNSEFPGVQLKVCLITNSYL